MRIAVTGAGGLLGAALAKRLESDGHDVLAMSRTPGAVGHGQGVRWDANDDWVTTAATLRGVEVVAHVAAHIPRDHSDAMEAQRCVDINALGTLRLVRAATASGVRRFVYVSGSNTLRPRAGKVKEDDPVGCEFAPYYLGSKVLGEIYVRAADREELACVIVRPSSIYGPGMAGGVLVSLADRLRAGQPIRLHDGGRFSADYVWRDDVAGVLARCAVDERRGSVNLGTGRATSLGEVAALLCEVLDADPALVTVEPPEAHSLTPGFAAVDIARARQWYGFEPTSLRAGLRRWLGKDGA